MLSILPIKEALADMSHRRHIWQGEPAVRIEATGLAEFLRSLFLGRWLHQNSECGAGLEEPFERRSSIRRAMITNPPGNVLEKISSTSRVISFSARVKPMQSDVTLKFHDGEVGMYTSQMRSVVE